MSTFCYLTNNTERVCVNPSTNTCEVTSQPGNISRGNCVNGFCQVEGKSYSCSNNYNERIQSNTYPERNFGGRGGYGPGTMEGFGGRGGYGPGMMEGIGGRGFSLQRAGPRI